MGNGIFQSLQFYAVPIASGRIAISVFPWPLFIYYMCLSEGGVRTQEALNTTLRIAFYIYYFRLKMVNLDATFVWLPVLCANTLCGGRFS